MNEFAMKIRKLLEGHTYSDTNKQLYAGFTLAQSIAYHLPLPTSPVDSVRSYFNQVHSHSVNTAISAFNESFVIDVGSVQAMVKSLYTMRYDLVHNPNTEDTVRLLMNCNDCQLPDELKQLAETNCKEKRLILDMLIRDFNQTLLISQ